MRNVMKAATLESKFPILSVEHDCIISKDADITECNLHRVVQITLFTLTQSDFLPIFGVCFERVLSITSTRELTISTSSCVNP